MISIESTSEKKNLLDLLRERATHTNQEKDCTSVYVKLDTIRMMRRGRIKLTNDDKKVAHAGGLEEKRHAICKAC